MQQKTRQRALALLFIVHIAGVAFCADSRRHLTQGVPQQPPFLPLPALNAQQQVYFPQWNQPGPQQSFAAAQQAQQQQLAQQQQQQQLLAQQQQQNTNFDNLVKVAAPSAGPVLAQAPGPAHGPSAAVFSPLAAPVMQAASMQAAGDTCTEKASVLVGSACFDFVGPFRLDYDHLASLGASDFEQAVALGPTPTNDCCNDAHAFVGEACACNARVASTAPALGMRPDAFKLVARAAVMACPRYNIVDPC
ncbi:g6011 [Coccomyxa elongata]